MSAFIHESYSVISNYIQCLKLVGKKGLALGLTGVFIIIGYEKFKLQNANQQSECHFKLFEINVV